MLSNLLQLQAGPLNLVYQSGNLRYISLGGDEVIRMIYAAVRDHNWNTFEPVILEEKIENDDKSFNISYQSSYGKEEILFKAYFHIEGKADGSIVFTMNGEAAADFYKNRIGFCVLHPIKECAGKTCVITNSEGSVVKKQFPSQISPHQPFEDISQMRWPISKKNYGQLIFKGDIFETEDQRNWTDASYKTYCTPLSLPFPVLIKKGEKVFQQVEFILERKHTKSKIIDKDSKSVSIELGTGQFHLPDIGIARNDEKKVLSNHELSLLSQLNFSHYRIELYLNKPDWIEKFQIAFKEAKQLNWKLELVLFFSENYKLEIESFVNIVSPWSSFVYSVTILSILNKVTPGILISIACKKLKDNLSNVKVGAGTNAYFAELNRERISNRDIDFVSYSINPQVHVFDNLSIIETLEAQQHTVKSAKLFSGNAEIHISPITLKPRFNPNATGKDPELEPGALPMQVDDRQNSLFVAGFTLGSIASLSKDGASALTFYETIGWRGIIQGDIIPMKNSRLKSEENMIFPVYFLFKALLSIDDAFAIPCIVDKPLNVSALSIKNNTAHQLFIANHSNTLLKIDLKNASAIKRILVFDEAAYQKCKFDAQSFENLWTNFTGQRIVVPAFSLIIVEFSLI